MCFFCYDKKRYWGNIDRFEHISDLVLMKGIYEERFYSKLLFNKETGLKTFKRITQYENLFGIKYDLLLQQKLEIVMGGDAYQYPQNMVKDKLIGLAEKIMIESHI